MSHLQSLTIMIIIQRIKLPSTKYIHLIRTFYILLFPILHLCELSVKTSEWEEGLRFGEIGLQDLHHI